MLSITDFIIIIFILIGGFVGFKRGVLKQGVKSLGIFLMFILAFVLKNPISVFLYKHLPFFKFTGVIKGVAVLNILVYEVIAFLLVLAILLVIFKILIFATNLFEKILDLTVILGAISSFLGMILGLVEYFILTFIILYVLALPIFNKNYFSDSKIGNFIISNTPIFSNLISKQYKVFDEFNDLKEKYKNEEDVNKFNLEALDLFLKYDIVDTESIDYLITNNKLKVEGADSLLNKYRKE